MLKDKSFRRNDLCGTMVLDISLQNCKKINSASQDPYPVAFWHCSPGKPKQNGRSKFSLFINDIIVYTEKSKEFLRKLLE